MPENSKHYLVLYVLSRVNGIVVRGAITWTTKIAVVVTHANKLILGFKF